MRWDSGTQAMLRLYSDRKFDKMPILLVIPFTVICWEMVTCPPSDSGLGVAPSPVTKAWEDFSSGEEGATGATFWSAALVSCSGALWLDWFSFLKVFPAKLGRKVIIRLLIIPQNETNKCYCPIIYHWHSCLKSPCSQVCCHLTEN